MALSSDLQTEAKRIEDIVAAVWNRSHCFALVPIGESVAVTPGTPLDQSGGTGGASLVTNGNEANVDAIALETVTSAGVGDNPNCLCIVRGPANVNADQLVLQASVTAAELKPYLLALGILLVNEPAEQEQLA